MAAGQGFKTFTTGEVLTAGDVNGYLMQGINVFTNSTARDAAITAPAEGQFAFTKDNNSLWYYDGAAWVASGATGDIEGVTATSPLTGGGTSGTVTVGIQSASTTQLGAVQLSDSTASTSTTLAATANAVKTTYDLANAAIPKSTVTTAGDIIYATGASTVTRRAIGSNGDILTVSGGLPVWSTPASGGGMTLLSTTNLSGTSTTVSSISQSYTNLLIILKNVGLSSASTIGMTINGLTGVYTYGFIRTINGTTSSNTNQSTSTIDTIFSNMDGAAAAARGNATITIPQYTNTSNQQITWTSQGSVNSTTFANFTTGAAQAVASAVTSVTFSSTATFNSGQIFIYGVK